AAPTCPEVVADAMRYSLEAGGKRLRPILTLAAAEAIASCRDRAPGAAGTFDEAHHLAMPAACAIELIHTYSLIHDDLPAMDDDTLRRGRPTLHVVVGEGLAILAGDGLQSLAFELLAREPRTAEPSIVDRELRTIGVIAAAAGPAGMVGGQVVDLEAVRPSLGRPPATFNAEGLRAMHARKTGALIRASAVSGAIMAGADDPVVDAIDRYAAEIGLAFQIVDDVLDVEGTAADLGKTAGKDAAAGKLTFPALYGIDRSRQLAAECIERATAAIDGAGLGGRLTQLAAWSLERRS